MKIWTKFLLALFTIVALRSGAETPKLKILAVSDVHDYWKQLGNIFKFIAPRQPDVVLCGGDVTRSYAAAESFRMYKKLFDEHFGKLPVVPVHIPIPGNHDYWVPKGQKWSPAKVSIERFYSNMGMKRSWLQEYKVKGYTFIAVAATDAKGENNHTAGEIKQVSEMIGRAEKSAPGQPVFVLTHCPPLNTLLGTWNRRRPPKGRWYWRYDLVRKMFDGHPQAVSISGHTHLALQDERAVWQGEFTAIHAGVLRRVSLGLPGDYQAKWAERPQISALGRGFIYIEVYENKMVIYRYDANNLKEISPEKRWVLKLPYAPAKAEYSAARGKNAVAPEFPAGAKAEIVKSGALWFLKLDRAQPEKAVHSYKVKMRLEGKEGVEEFYVLSDFFVPANRKRKNKPLLQIPNRIKLAPGMKGRIEVFPVEVWGKEGKGIKCDFVIK